MKKIYVLGLIGLVAVSLFAGVSGKVEVLPVLKHTGPTGLTSPSEVISSAFSWAVTSGTGANQMDLLYASQRTLAASTNETLDLYNSITDNFGTTLDFARVKVMIIVSASTNGDDIAIGGAASNAFTNWVNDATDKVNVRPGGVLCIGAPAATGYPVTDSTGDKLLITNTSTNGVTYDIYIGGSSS